MHSHSLSLIGLFGLSPSHALTHFQLTKANTHTHTPILPPSSTALTHPRSLPLLRENFQFHFSWFSFALSHSFLSFSLSSPFDASSKHIFSLSFSLTHTCTRAQTPTHAHPPTHTHTHAHTPSLFLLFVGIEKRASRAIRRFLSPSLFSGSRQKSQKMEKFLFF